MRVLTYICLSSEALDVIGHRLRNGFEIVASTKFLEVGYALKQRTSMQVTRRDRFSRSLYDHMHVDDIYMYVCVCVIYYISNIFSTQKK